jgi:hypothetical protein
MTRFENFGVFVREKIWLENNLSILAQVIFEPNIFPYKYSNILEPSHSSYLPACEDGMECSETSAYKIQKSGITQKKAYIIQNTAKVLNQDVITSFSNMQCKYH